MATTQDPSMMDKATSFADAHKVEPLTNEFDESKSTAGRVSSIINENSPLMQQAATSGTQLAAARGLTNSSLAAQASQSAVLDKATPIASTDASLFSQNQLANLAAKNAAATTNANNATSLGGIALTGENQAGMQKEALANSNTQQDKNIASTEGMQTKSLAQQAEQFNTQSSQAQQQIDAQISQFAQSLGMTAQDLALRRDSLTQNQQQFLANLEQQKAIADQTAKTQTEIATLNSNTQKTIAQLSQDTQLKVAGIEAQYKGDIQGSTNIANAWGSTLQQISTIQNNPNLEKAAKTTLIQNQLDGFAAFSAFWKKSSGGTVDVSDLLNWTTEPVTAPTVPGTTGDSGAVPSGVPGWDPRSVESTGM